MSKKASENGGACAHVEAAKTKQPQTRSDTLSASLNSSVACGPPDQSGAEGSSMGSKGYAIGMFPIFSHAVEAITKTLDAHLRRLSICD